MSQADQGNKNIPVQRKRGRPRKHPQPNNSGHNAASIGINSPPPTAPPGFERRVVRTTDVRVGSVVCGFIDAEFDGGYMLTVRGDNFHTTLKGVLYKPGSYPHVSAENGVGLGDPMIRRNEVPDVHGSSTCVPSARPPLPPPSNGSTVETQGRENNEVATWVNQPSTEALLQAEARYMILPEMPFEELVSEVVKRIHDPS
ncbi:PREDICTED: uncharacterized protein LOC103326513 [Prunus mume]|uniref:Uncharacterized protein LOC103326513 n=1 Tax=Prunus mume TaxID=102107 RepID=A0ABM0NME4_PRUMU|nr:PREDICTED: uncharacterized protein LOC103326513 [Prunus mume]